MFSFLYYIFIKPLEILFETVLNYSLMIVPIDFIIFVLSIVVQILLVPLYRLTHKIENREKDRKKSVDEALALIKKDYKGEALFKETEKIYKKFGYNPLLSFRSSISLFLIIPFFIAAYNTLNNNPLFLGQTFFGLFKFDSPDAMLFGINLLPILMTIFNLISIRLSNINNKFFDKGNYMLFILTVFFLVYLYNGSSALLLYWTTNNFIYMLKLLSVNKFFKNHKLIT